MNFIDNFLICLHCFHVFYVSLLEYLGDCAKRIKRYTWIRIAASATYLVSTITLKYKSFNEIHVNSKNEADAPSSFH